MSEVFVGRQPIYNRKLKVIGYELLYRQRGDVNTAQFDDPDAAISDVIINTFVNIGLEKLVGKKLAFINLAKGFFTGDYPLPLPPDKVVIEVLEDIRVDDDTIGYVKAFSDKGFKIALDDIADPDGLEPLLDIASIAKIDMRLVRSNDLAALVEKLRKHDVKIVAEKIENMQEYEFCAKHGFDYYQGYFLERPKIVSGRSMPGSTLTVMRLLSRLQAEDVQLHDIEEIVRQDVSLSYALLRVINSAYYSLNNEIQSIQDALVMLGIDRLRSWLSLILVSRIEDKPAELIKTAMVRARMCEVLAVSVDGAMGGAGFMTGLFSVLEALLGRPVEEILEMLPISEDIKLAIEKHEGTLGEILKCTLDYEHWDWDSFSGGRFDADMLNTAYLEALDWATGAGSISGI